MPSGKWRNWLSSISYVHASESGKHTLLSAMISSKSLRSAVLSISFGLRDGLVFMAAKVSEACGKSAKVWQFYVRAHSRLFAAIMQQLYLSGKTTQPKKW
jgi:hypothetical protein